MHGMSFFGVSFGRELHPSDDGSADATEGASRQTARQATTSHDRPGRYGLRAAGGDASLAHAANVTGLASEVKTAVKGDRALIKDIRQARRDARKAIRSLRHSKS